MSKQDRQGVRTAPDLERKYKLAQMQKAFEQAEKSITRINKIQEDFVNTIIGTLENFEGLTDGMVTTYFNNGQPTNETFPTIEWADELDNHINDLYYDRESGKAYTFLKTEEAYAWEEVVDEDKIKVLAMANATTDAQDNKRRIFVEQPTPPYENGDLWLKDGVIYVCQISKPETEAHEEQDFIISSSYTGDTLAIKAGKELQVLRGTVLKIIEDTSFLNATIYSLDNNTKSEIELLKTALSTLIVGENGESQMVQTENGWNFDITSMINDIRTNTQAVEDVEGSLNAIKPIKQYVNIGTYEDKPCIELGDAGNPELGIPASPFKIIITNEEILFFVNGETPAYINEDTMVIDRALINNEIQIGTMAWVKRSNGHISFIWKEVVEDVGTE